MNHEKQSRASSGKEVTASGMSSFDSVDGSEATKFDASKQPMPTPRSWSTATVETSREAARFHRSTSSATCRTILGTLQIFGPMSCEEIADEMRKTGTNIILNTVRARVCDLHKAGLLRDSTKRSVGESGKCRVVRWEVVA